MRVPFDSIFAHTEGRFIPQVHVSIGNVTTAAGTPLCPTLAISGIKIGDLIDCELAIEQEGGIAEISGFYRPGEPPVSIQGA